MCVTSSDRLADATSLTGSVHAPGIILVWLREPRQSGVQSLQSRAVRASRSWPRVLFRAGQLDETHSEPGGPRRERASVEPPATARAPAPGRTPSGSAAATLIRP